MHRRISHPSFVPTLEHLEPRTMLSGTTDITSTTTSDLRTLVEGESALTWKELNKVDATNLQWAKTAFVGDPIVHQAGDVVNVRARFTPGQSSIGDRIVLAERRDADSRNQLYDAMGVEFSPTGKMYLFLAQNKSWVWKQVIDTAPIPAGTTAEVDLTYDGTTIRASLSASGKVIGNASGTPPVRYQQYSVGASNILWDVADADRLEGLTIQRQWREGEMAPEAVDAILSDAAAFAEILRDVDVTERAVEDPAILYQGVHDPVRFASFFETRKTTMAQEDAGMHDGKIALNERVQFLSNGEYRSTPEAPLDATVHVRFRSHDDGLVFLTRTDGQVYGDRGTGLSNGLEWDITTTGTGIYLWRMGGGRAVLPYRSFPRLETGKDYTVEISDQGTNVHLRILDGASVIFDGGGAIPEAPVAHRFGMTNLRWENPGGVDVTGLSVHFAGVMGPLQISAYDRLQALMSTASLDFGIQAFANVQGGLLYRQSPFVIEKSQVPTIAARHPNYGASATVNRDLMVRVERDLQIYDSVMPNLLIKGIAVKLAELRKESTAATRSAFDNAYGSATQNKYASELATFGVTFPSPDAILQACGPLLAYNIDQIIDTQAASQSAKELQDWDATHTGDTAKAPLTPEEELAKELQRLTLNKTTLVQAWNAAGLDGLSVYATRVAAVEQGQQISAAEDAMIAAGIQPEKSDEAIYAELERLAQENSAQVLGYFSYAGMSTEELTSAFGQESALSQLLQSKAFHWLVMQHPEKWWSRSTATPSDPAVAVRSDTSAGILYHGIAQQLWRAKNVLFLESIIAQSSTLLGLSAADLRSLDRSSPAIFARNLQRIFSNAGYGDLFSASPQVPENVASVRHATVDGHLFLHGDIPVRWDVALGGKTVHHSMVYLVDNMTTKHQASQTPLVELTGLATSARIPVESLGMNGDNMGFKIAVWFTDGTTAGGYIENPFVVAWDGKESRGEVPSDSTLQEYVSGWSSLSSAQQETVRQALTFNYDDLAEGNKNAQLIQWLLDTFLKTSSPEEHRMVWDTTNEQWIGEAYDASNFALNGECKYWVDDVVVKGAFGGQIDLPSLKYDEKTDENGNVIKVTDKNGYEYIPNESYRWNPDNQIETITEKDSFDDSEMMNLILSGTIKSGDLVQLSDDSFGDKHTFIVGAITSTGMWVFDSNREASKAPAYSFIANASLDGINKFTVYRLK